SPLGHDRHLRALLCHQPWASLDCPEPVAVSRHPTRKSQWPQRETRFLPESQRLFRRASSYSSFNVEVKIEVAAFICTRLTYLLGLSLTAAFGSGIAIRRSLAARLGSVGGLARACSGDGRRASAQFGRTSGDIGRRSARTVIGLSRNRRPFNGWVGLKTLEISRSLRRGVNSEFPEVVELNHCIIHRIFNPPLGRRRNYPGYFPYHFC